MTAAAPPLLVIAGATATGKTGLAIRLALALRDAGTPAEVISADSRQVYRGLDIGTAKPTLEERRGVPHHGLDLVDPDGAFSVADFADHVAAVLPPIAAAGGLAILAGGTGFYLRAIARGLDTKALPSDPAVRATIEAKMIELGVAAGAARLQSLAPTLAGRIDLRNPRRVARALKIAEIAGDVPLCESSRGALIRPPMTIVLSEGEAAQIEAPMNRYVSGLWTCRNDAGQSVTDVARYLGGQFLSMPGVMLDTR